MTPVRCVPDPTPDYRSLFLAACFGGVAIAGCWLLWKETRG